MVLIETLLPRVVLGGCERPAGFDTQNRVLGCGLTLRRCLMGTSGSFGGSTFCFFIGCSATARSSSESEISLFVLLNLISGDPSSTTYGSVHRSTIMGSYNAGSEFLGALSTPGKSWADRLINSRVLSLCCSVWEQVLESSFFYRESSFSFAGGSYGLPSIFSL